MMELIFREQARADLRNVMTWFREQNDRSEGRFEDAFDTELLYIRQFPLGYQLRRPPFRFAMVGRFKYFIIYAVVGNVLVIHRIRHMHQRPLTRYFVA